MPLGITTILFVNDCFAHQSHVQFIAGITAWPRSVLNHDQTPYVQEIYPEQDPYETSQTDLNETSEMIINAGKIQVPALLCI